jgi:hypothetical protein
MIRNNSQIHENHCSTALNKVNNSYNNNNKIPVKEGQEKDE